MYDIFAFVVNLYISTEAFYFFHYGMLPILCCDSKYWFEECCIKKKWPFRLWALTLTRILFYFYYHSMMVMINEGKHFIRTRKKKHSQRVPKQKQKLRQKLWKFISNLYGRCCELVWCWKVVLQWSVSKSQNDRSHLTN